MQMEALPENPTSIANMQIDYFYKKVDDLINELPVTLIDPLKVLKNAFERWKLKADLISPMKIQAGRKRHYFKTPKENWKRRLIWI